MHRLRRAPCLTLAAPLVLCTFALRPLSAQTDDARWLADCGDNGERVSVCDVRVVRLAPGITSLRVDGADNGGVAVHGWDGDSVVVHERLRASAPSEEAARAMLKAIRVQTTGTLQAEGPRAGRGQGYWVVSYVIDVPRRFDLDITTRNGGIGIVGVTGTMQLRAVNGPVALDAVGGDVHARAQNGPLAVTLTGTRWTGRALDAETQNGPVTLRMPPDYAAHLETGTDNGPFSVSFPLRVTLQGERTKQIESDINGGGPLVRVVTTNGPAAIRAAR